MNSRKLRSIPETLYQALLASDKMLDKLLAYDDHFEYVLESATQEFEEETGKTLHQIWEEYNKEEKEYNASFTKST